MKKDKIIALGLILVLGFSVGLSVEYIKTEIENSYLNKIKKELSNSNLKFLVYFSSLNISVNEISEDLFEDLFNIENNFTVSDCIFHVDRHFTCFIVILENKNNFRILQYEINTVGIAFQYIPFHIAVITRADLYHCEFHSEENDFFVFELYYHTWKVGDALDISKPFWWAK